MTFAAFLLYTTIDPWAAQNCISSYAMARVDGLEIHERVTTCVTPDPPEIPKPDDDTVECKGWVCPS